MKIYFCDICNESIPLKDINSNRITIEDGKIFCQKCAPKKARASERAPGLVVALLVALILAVASLGVIGWQLISEQEAEREALQGKVEGLDSSFEGLQVGALSGLREGVASATVAAEELHNAITLLRQDLTTTESEIRSRHDGLDRRDKDQYIAQQKATLVAIERLMATLEPEIESLKNKVRTLDMDLNSDAMLEIKVLKEKLQLLQDVVTARAAIPAVGTGEPTDPPAVDGAAGAIADGGASLEDREITAHIEKLAAADPGKRYSAVIALSRYSGDRVVAALEGMLSPEADPEDYVRVAVIQTLRKLGRATSIPHIIGALRDTDYFVRVAA
ncbi:MAG: HEAT repeat domain-containing protein, partial [Planctomycetes bacterium]|nr:HEAT repeat domain-containing protein [Planctomycetota bacterium]